MTRTSLEDPKPIMDNSKTGSRARGALVVLLLTVLLFLYATALYFTVTSKFVGANDYYSRWAGARALFAEQRNPYAGDVTREIQIGMFGHPMKEDEDQVAFAYPLYTVYTIGPMALLPYPQAQALWQALLQFAIVGATVLFGRFVGLKLRPLVLAALVLWAILFYPDLRGFFLGQYAILVFFFLVASLGALRAEKDILGGFLLAWTTIKPQMVVFLVPLLLIWAVRQRRWRYPIAFIVTMALLIGSSMLLVPGWLADFVTATFEYQRYTQAAFDGKPTLKHLTDFFFGGSGNFVYQIGALALFVGMLVVWFRSLRRPESSFEGAISITAIATILFPFDQATTNQILLLLPIIYSFSVMSKMPGGWIIAVLSGVLLLVGPWGFFLLTFKDKTEQPLQFPLLPVLVLAIGVVVYWWKWRSVVDEVGS